MKTVLCIGAAGFLGQNLCRALLKKGYKVSGLDNLSIGTREWLPHNISFYEKNVTWIGKTQNYFKFDAIIHLASRKIPRYGGADKVLIENTENMKTIISLAVKTGAKLIYLSSSDIYGKQNEFKETSDSIIGSATIPRWSYAISKMWGEQLLYSSIPNLDFNIIRLFNTYGPYYALHWLARPLSVFISQALKKEPITIHGNGFQRRCYQYVDDAIDGIMAILESDYNREIFNIGNPYEDISVNDLAELVWKKINPDIELRYKNIPHSTSGKYEEIMARIPDISKAKRLLEFDPKVMLTEGLGKTIEWQKGVTNL